MIEVLILKIEDPGCFWVILKGCGSFVDNEVEYRKLHAEMNQFYNQSCRDVDEVKPLMVEEGQVCVVFCQELRCWCRAVIKTIMSCTEHCLVECFLVDYAKYIPVKTRDIRVAVEAFMRLPYRARKFRLYCIKPVTLHINFCEDTAEIVPAKAWDGAAIQYFQKLLRETTQIEAKLCAIEDEHFDVYLYVTAQDEKVCVNDELVAKNFACYMSTEENTNNPANKPSKQSPLSLVGFPEKVINPVLALWPVLLQGKAPKNLKTGHTASNPLLEKNCKNLSTTSFNGHMESTVGVFLGFPFKEHITISGQTDSDLLEIICKKQLKKVEHDEKSGCVKLLQFLNPDPSKTDHFENEKQEFLKVSAEQHFVFNKKIEPCSSLETAPLLVNLKKELLWNKFQGPTFTQSYCWPPIARGCDVVVISHHGNDPLLYIPPILTFLQSRGCYKSLPSGNGPTTLIVCPGWKKAQLIFELLKKYGRCSRPLHPLLLLVGLNNEEVKNMKLQQGCEVIVTTPYSLLRLLEHHSLLLLRLCHLVLDEVEVLLSEASKQVFMILEYYRKTIPVAGRESAPRQIVVVGTRWNKHIEHVTREFMNDPYIVITSMEEASIYGNVQQVVHLSLDCDKISVLLRILDFTPSNAQKTLIFTNSVDETEMVYRAVESSAIFCLKIHKEIEYHFKYVEEQWRKKFSPGTHVVLVLTDDCMKYLGITDATCVVHFSFPSSPSVFGIRLHSMSDNFRSGIEKSSLKDDKFTKAKSILLLTERNGCHAGGVLHYLEHTDAKIPPELSDFTAGVLKAKEDMKLARPVCHYLKTLGVCKNMRICPDRHQVNLQIDFPPKSSDQITSAVGYITILPLHIVDATNYFGRIVDKKEDQYAILAVEMDKYFKKASNKVSVEMVKKLSLYGLHEEKIFHRVQVLEIFPKEENGFFYNVTIKYVDEGRTGQVQGHQLFPLPAEFQSLPPQAVEFIVCRVKPIDNETEWNPKITRYIHQKIKGKLHEARVVLTLGNTVWVDPMVQVTRLPDLKISVNEYNIRSEILSMGMGTDNPEHIKQLQKLCESAKMLAPEKKTLQTSIRDVASPQREPEQDVDSVQSPLLGEKLSENCNFSQTILDQSGPIAKIEVENSTQHHHKCFYPEIKWFQKEDTVTMKIKIRNVTDCKCEFLRNRVIFSAFSEDKFYLVDTELYENILTEKSVCEVKNEEPVIILAKEKKESWLKLLKYKNPNVSFDFEHWEDCGDESPFPVGAEKLHHPATLAMEEMEESSDSETESGD
ncbi:PREDICTED: putative ATP-dependent RNA helicase TDRD12 [Gavialis gangeticus]|uniref:putative ATP-dependent RNA helicase TDRD12 n=1 Tax=Gavialis gangeticus TaxID=94835 RepID=UPI00092F1C9B|nr:PREDICTED: putative ATP-dependent RNA helicase TDRD12 [Gavialis gangeticus]